MGKSSRNRKRINKKININSFKSFILLAIFAVSLFVSVTRVHATEQTPEPEQNSEQQGSQEPEAQTASQDETVVTGVEITTTTMMYAVKNVNVRKEPNTRSEILGELETGTNIFAVELTDEGWYRVVYDGETGYIRGDFLAVFGDMDEWSASEPEPELEPIVEQDITDAEESGADNQTEDNTENDGAIENTEGDAADNTGETQAEEPSNGKNNIFTILIIVTLVVVIFVYAVIQIVRDNMNPDEEYGENSEAEVEIEDLNEDE